MQPDEPFHGLEGLKHLDSAIVPGIYDPSVPDETLFISTEAAYDAAKRLVEEEGLMVGPSGGAALAASLQIAARLAPPHRETPAVIVMVFPDAGSRHGIDGGVAFSDERRFSS